MKKLLSLIPLCFALSATAQITNVNVGSAANDNTGDGLRTAFTKLNTSIAYDNTNALHRTNNLSDVANAATARGNLGAGTGNGSVTSAAFTGDGTVFNSSVTGSPITTTGTFAPSLHTQSSNSFFAGPTSGSAATPTFRGLVDADIPSTLKPTVTAIHTKQVTLIYSGTTNVVVDLTLGSSFYLLITNSTTFMYCTNGTAGDSFSIEIQQDGTGSRALNLTTNGSICAPSGFRASTTQTANSRDWIGGKIAHTGTNYDIGQPQNFTTVLQ